MVNDGQDALITRLRAELTRLTANFWVNLRHFGAITFEINRLKLELEKVQLPAPKVKALIIEGLTPFESRMRFNVLAMQAEARVQQHWNNSALKVTLNLGYADEQPGYWFTSSDDVDYLMQHYIDYKIDEKKLWCTDYAMAVLGHILYDPKWRGCALGIAGGYVLTIGGPDGHRWLWLVDNQGNGWHYDYGIRYPWDDGRFLPERLEMI